MYYEPAKLDKYTIRKLQRMDETDTIEAIGILQRRLLNMKNENYHLEIRVEELPLSTKASNLLMENKLRIVKDVFAFGLNNLYRIRNLGPKTILEIKTVLPNWKNEKIRSVD